MITRPPSKASVIFFTGFLVFYVLSVFINWSVLPLDGEEPRRAIVSIEMLQSGNYIMPSIFDWPYYKKPPVFNWVQSLPLFLFGTAKEWVFRLPSLLFLLAWAFCHYWFSKKFFPKPIAALSAVFLLTNFDLFFYALGAGGEIDIFYSFLVYLQVMVLFYFNQQQQWTKLFTFSYFFCALGFLTKGFPSLTFQAFTLLALCAYNKSLLIIFRWQHVLGLLVFGALVGTYLYFYSFYNPPGWFIINLANESLLKSAVGSDAHRLWGKLLVYPFSFLKLMLPWSLLLFFLFKKYTYRLKENSFVWFSILFIAFNIWIYAFSGIPNMRYVYMFIPFAYNIVIYIFWKTSEENSRWTDKMVGYAGFVFPLVVLMLIALPFFMNVGLARIIFFAIALSAFSIAYYRMQFNRVWMLCCGFILLRMLYASVFIPIQANGLRIHYRNVVAEMLAANDGGEITYWTQPQTHNLGIYTKHIQWNGANIILPPFLYCQFPYYNYYFTGRIMKYDTVLAANKTYLTFRSELRRNDVIELWSWYDVRQRAELVLFKLN